MKIAMMTNNYKPFIGGVPVSIERLADSLRKLGHQVVVFAPDYKNCQQEEDVVRYRSFVKGVVGGISVPNSFDPVIEKKFREGNFDVIHVHHPMLIGATARYLAKKYHVPLVFTYHTRYEEYLHYVGLSALKGIVPEYIKSCVSSCQLVIAPTPLIRDYLQKIPVRPEVRVLPTGLSPKSFQVEEGKAAAIRKRFAGDKKYLFCTVSRLAKEKNIEFLLRCMKRRKDVSGSDFRMMLIGDGPEHEHLEELSEKLGLQDEIIFMGALPNEEIKNYCKASDLFLFASRSETQGIVLLESMAVGTPVIAVKATGTEDIVKSGFNGYMTSVSEEEFSEKLMDILEKKEPEILREGAVQTAQRYNCIVIAQEAVRIYNEAIFLLNAKKRRTRVMPAFS